MFRILLGILAPLAIIYLAWSFGELPAKSVFWKTATAEVTEHETGEFETGYGPSTMTFPKVSGAVDTPLRLNVHNRFDDAGVKADWPVGSTLAVRIHPNGETAYPANDPRLRIVIPTIIGLGCLLVICFAVGTLLTGASGLSFFMGGIGAAFVTIASVLFFGLWTFGEPPATSWFWPTETVTTALSEVDSAPIGNGNTNYFPVVSVTRSNGETAPLMIKRKIFMSENEARSVAGEYAMGTRHSVRVSPNGRLFERYWQFQFLLAIAISVVAPLIAIVGLFVMMGALKSSKR